MNKLLITTMLVLVIECSPVLAQGEMSMSPTTAETQEKMHHEAMPSMEGMEDGDMSSMDHDMNHENDDAHDMTDMSGMSHESHDAMQHNQVSTGLRDPNAYADGYTLSSVSHLHEADELDFGLLLIDRLEVVHSDNNTSAAYDVQAWYGSSYDRAVLKAEGDVDNGKVQDGRAELLWGHAITPFWDAQLGLSVDHGVDPGRGWLAFGVQGLAPYWFEVDATAYVGSSGRTALRLSGEYDLLLTQKLILQPRLEGQFYGKRDAERQLGSGLSDLTAGLRLRYQIRREFAPYVGIEWAGKCGGTADYAQSTGNDTAETRAVAGVRFWF